MILLAPFLEKQYNKSMEIKRFFVSHEVPVKIGEPIRIYGDEFIHAVKVSRYKVGYKLILSNGDGFDYFCVVTEVGKDFFECVPERAEKNGNELTVPLALYMCAIEKTDVAVQKATEIGASEIRLMISAFTNAKNQNLDRLNKIALESAKQCGRAVVPKIYAPVSFEEGVEDAAKRFSKVIFCYENATSGRIASEISEKDSSVAIVIGSEGGFSPDEVRFAEERGAKVVTLGRRILRAETACIVSLAFAAEELEKYENLRSESRM